MLENHKTKLVPGAERIPFPYFLNSISAFSVDLGGISGSLGRANSIYTFSISGLRMQQKVYNQTMKIKDRSSLRLTKDLML